jgi:hypothetical protein
LNNGEQRAAILDMAKACICQDRNAQYGPPERNFEMIAEFWTTYLAGRSTAGGPLSATDVAVMMSLMKIARIAHNPGKCDSWTDAIGYLACGGEVAGAK